MSAHQYFECYLQTEFCTKYRVTKLTVDNYGNLLASPGVMGANQLSPSTAKSPFDKGCWDVSASCMKGVHPEASTLHSAITIGLHEKMQDSHSESEWCSKKRPLVWTYTAWIVNSEWAFLTGPFRALWYHCCSAESNMDSSMIQWFMCILTLDVDTALYYNYEKVAKLR